MLVESGLVRVSNGKGKEFTFRPSFGLIASLGSPEEIVDLFARLHGPRPEADAVYVLACLCDQDDVTPLIGWLDSNGRVSGAMSEGEMVIIARHLMRHGIVGKARPEAGGGKFSDRFDAAEYVAAAQVHLGLSNADAEGLSMTEFQKMFEMKFPDAGEKRREVPSRDEYDAALKAIEERGRG